MIERLLPPDEEPDAFARRDALNALVMHMDIALERSIRSWGAFDPAVQEAINATDRQRVDAVIAQFDAGASEEVHARAAAQYAAYLGFITIQDPATVELLSKWAPRAEIVFRDELAEGPPAPPPAD